MSVELTKDNRNANHDLIEAVAQDLLEGKCKETIVRELNKAGWPEDSAGAFVNRVETAVRRYRETPHGRAVLTSLYTRQMVHGFFWTAGGTLLTAVTYNASSEGGIYMVMSGAIIFGVMDVLKGFFGWLQYQ